MWVCKRTEPGVYTVGFYEPDGTWQPWNDFGSKSEAEKKANYLNGAGGDCEDDEM